MIQNMWVPYASDTSSSTVVQFMHNLKKVKKESMNWAHEHHKTMEADIYFINDNMAYFSCNHPQWFSNLEQKYYYMELECKGKNILDEKKLKCCHKETQVGSI